jgi:hypothetical protein
MTRSHAEADGEDTAASGKLADDLEPGPRDAHEPPSQPAGKPDRHGGRIPPETEAIVRRMDRLFWQHSLRRMRGDEKEGKSK